MPRKTIVWFAVFNCPDCHLRSTIDRYNLKKHVPHTTEKPDVFVECPECEALTPAEGLAPQDLIDEILQLLS